MFCNSATSGTEFHWDVSKTVAEGRAKRGPQSTFEIIPVAGSGAAAPAARNIMNVNVQ